MQPSSKHYYPLALPFILVFALLIFVIVGMVEFGLLKCAYERMGVPPRYVVTVLLLSLLGALSICRYSSYLRRRWLPEEW